MNPDIIKIGNKIEIRILQQAAQQQNDGSKVKVYRSQVQEIRNNGWLEIAVPIEEGRMVLLPFGVRYEFVFYTKNGLYRCVAQIRERFKSNNLYLFLVEPKTQLEKFQRREYYRFECAMIMSYQVIKESEAKIEDMNKLKAYHSRIRPDDLPKTAVAVDISGGGIRFITVEPTEEDTFLFISIQLKNESIDWTLETVGRVLSCRAVETSRKEKKYEYRVQFLLKDQRKREMIIKYIFEQERKSRQKG